MINWNWECVTINGMNPEEINRIVERFKLLKPFLNEKQLRLWSAAEALSIGYKGIWAVARATGVSRRAITVGKKELAGKCSVSQPDHVRRPGGGRKKIQEKDPTLKTELEQLIDPYTRGDPESPLKWTAKSVRHLADELKQRGHQVSYQLVAELLKGMNYSLQANQKTREGGKHPDRNAQFEHINEQVKRYQAAGQPVLSVDAKKKELVGPFKNGGHEIRPKGDPEEVNVYDFKIPALGKVTPYGVYDVMQNSGWVNVGVDHDTAQFAVASIRYWWLLTGKHCYPEAKQLLIMADAGGSNSRRCRLWKLELQKLANETGLEISVCHFPPGTSKWNKIEHRLFSFISQNWRGKPLVSHQVIVNMIAATKTKTGLKVNCQLDLNKYPLGIKVSNQEMASIHLVTDPFHGEWNYSILPA